MLKSLCVHIHAHAHVHAHAHAYGHTHAHAHTHTHTYTHTQGMYLGSKAFHPMLKHTVRSVMAVLTKPLLVTRQLAMRKLVFDVYV